MYISISVLLPLLFSSFLVFQNSVFHYYFSLCRTCFSHSLMVGLLTANFVFADWRYFYFLFILKDSFAKYRNCALAVLFLQFLKNIPLPSGTRGFQVMRSLLSYNLLSISWWCVVFLWQLSRFCSFFFYFQKFNCDVSWHGFLWIYPVWDQLSLLNL